MISPSIELYRCTRARSRDRCPECGGSKRHKSRRCAACRFKPRPILLQPDDPTYRLVPLTQGKVALVDTSDFDAVSVHQWYASISPHRKTFYAKAMIPDETGKKRFVTMVVFLLGRAPRGLHRDHINHNTLDNRRRNLRTVTCSENQMNRLVSFNSKTGFKGVTLDGKSGKFRATIHKNGKAFHLGLHSTPEKAAAAYNEKCIELHGEFACLNPLPVDALIEARKEQK
jgi:HNH endonuclease/AP2 domain